MNDLALYNEIDDFAADWLENLIRAGEIAPGRVERRSILDLTPDDILPFKQFHAFAGIGLWSAALRGAGIRDDEPVWTGSCPCQPFSAAGKGGGFDDERHLWPAFHWLIAQCRPCGVLGEQVASKDGLAWLDLVQSDLEGTGYAAGAVDICSAGFGAPHIRQRLYWLALDNAADPRRDDARQHDGGPSLLAPRFVEPSDADELADTDEQVQSRRGIQRPGQGDGASDGTTRQRSEGLCAVGQLADADSARSQGRPLSAERAGERAAGPVGLGSGLADADGWHTQDRSIQRSWQHGFEPQDDSVVRSEHRGIGHNAGPELDRPGPVNGFWRNSDWLYCRDGKWRPVEAGTQPLAHGLPRGMGNLSPELRRLAELAELSQQSLAGAKAHRIGSLRGYGNAINYEQAVEFVRAAYGR
jgi:DNA (cytosine-5)-methyltransferase 1